MNPPLEDADVETASGDYARRFESPVGAWMLGVQERITLDLLEDLQGASILDVGGGHGQVAPELAARGFQVSVLASSPAAISRALQPHLDSGRVSLFTGNLRQPPIEPASFDAVLSYRLLPHAHDLPGLIEGLTGVARRAVIVDYPTSRSLNAVADPFFAAKKKVEGNTRPFRVFPDRDLIALFQGRGFRLKRRRPQFLVPMALHRAFGLPALSRLLEGAAGILGLRALFGSPVIARFDRV